MIRTSSGGLSLLLLVLLAACSAGGDGAVITSEYQDLPSDRVLYGAETQITVKGVREVVLRADSMYADEDSTTAQLYGVKLVKYDTLGRTTANVTSRKGRYNQRTQKLLAQGSVVVVLSDGRRIETEELNYDPESHRIWSDVFTRMRYPASQGGGSTTFETFATDDKFLNPSGTGLQGRIPGLKL
jgi:LPS export ABC transporter protein LptC